MIRLKQLSDHFYIILPNVIIILALIFSGPMLADAVGAPPFLINLAWFIAFLGLIVYDIGAIIGKSLREGVWKDIAYAIWIVSIIVNLAYIVSATWPVMVAVESGSMEPNIHPGDLVFVLGTAREVINTYDGSVAINHTSFGKYGDIVVYRPGGDPGKTPIIHRAMYWKASGESAKQSYCKNPLAASHDGYITLGDANNGMCDFFPVKPEWIVGVAKFRVPLLGYFRLIFPKVG